MNVAPSPESARAERAYRPSATRITVLATLFTALGPITMSMYAPAMPSLAVSLGTSVAMVQLTLTVYLIAFALAQLAHGPLSDRLGRRPVLLAGFGVYLVGAGAAALATVMASLFGANAAWALATIPLVLTAAGLALFLVLIGRGGATAPARMA